MELMREYPDKHFDLAIVDPPYGIDMDGGKIGKSENFKKKNWDENIPDKFYFDELFRISKNQIVWGGNYMTQFLPPSKAWCYWDKMQDGFGKTFSSGELAWSSFDCPMKQIRYKYQGNYEGFEDSITTKSSKPALLKIHPTQKPVKLYEWLLTNYAKEGNKILDTHLGSGSHAIACNNLGFELIACELDTDYFEAACKRIRQEAAQERLFA
jgi:site-specific DNA-methyltransferase (adenine-specific)